MDCNVIQNILKTQTYSTPAGLKLSTAKNLIALYRSVRDREIALVSFFISFLLTERLKEYYKFQGSGEAKDI